MVKKLPIISNTFIKNRFYKLTLLSNENYNPGQFIHIRVNDFIDPLLRRPFSIYRVKHGSIEILYEVIGNGTLGLSKRRVNELLDVVGPLGNSFSDNIEGKKPLLVGGGIGVAPLFFLAEKLITKGYTPRVILGYRSYDNVIAVDDFTTIGVEPIVVTDDGSYGHSGLVTDIIGRYIDSNTMIFSCGPMSMLSSVSSIAYYYSVSCELSLHNFMGCGFGVCLGCVIMSPNGYKRVCKDGPIFSFDQISIGI